MRTNVSIMSHLEMKVMKEFLTLGTLSQIPQINFYNISHKRQFLEHFHVQRDTILK